MTRPADYQAMKAAGICADCGNEVEETTPKRARCQQCRRDRAALRKCYLDSGLCPVCHKEPCRPLRASCAKCATAAAIHHRNFLRRRALASQVKM